VTFPLVRRSKLDRALEERDWARVRLSWFMAEWGLRARVDDLERQLEAERAAHRQVVMEVAR